MTDSLVTTGSPNAIKCVRITTGFYSQTVFMNPEYVFSTEVFYVQIFSQIYKISGMRPLIASLRPINPSNNINAFLFFIIRIRRLRVLCSILAVLGLRSSRQRPQMLYLGSAGATLHFVGYSPSFSSRHWHHCCLDPQHLVFLLPDVAVTQDCIYHHCPLLLFVDQHDVR